MRKKTRGVLFFVWCVCKGRNPVGFPPGPGRDERVMLFKVVGLVALGSRMY